MIMKNIFSLLFLFTFFISCKKDPAITRPSDLTGKWEFSVTMGFGIFPPTAPAGNGRTISFKRNGVFQRSAHDTLLFNGIYLLRTKSDCAQEKATFLSTNDPGFVNNFTVMVRNDSLFISTPSCYIDGATSIYKKISD
jgi:hypothetical protein